MIKITITALRTLLALTLLTGVLYPILVSGLSKWIWPFQAEGSLIVENGQIRGSTLIAQKFEQDRYFWPRPSAVDYQGTASGASNLGLTSAKLKQNYEERLKAGLTHEMLFTSGSGLDPHISFQAAEAQIERIAAARSLTQAQQELLMTFIQSSLEGPDMGILGEPRVNVLKLNLKLDESFSKIEN